jgi:thiol-disulfide isomerase/thioredoxin
MWPRLKRLTALVATLCMTGVAGPSPAAAMQDAPGLDLSAYRGKVVLVDFWASWCAPCRMSFPYMERMQRTYAREGLVVVAVNVDHSRERADQFLSQLDHDFRIVYDPKAEVVSRFKINEMPTSILFDKNGKPRFTHYGFFPEKSAVYEAHIATLIAEQ